MEIIAREIAPPVCYGLLRRRRILLPTWRLMVMAAVLLGTPVGYGFLHAYHWLAVTEPVTGAPNMVVEGWMPDPILHQAAEHARVLQPQAIFCTGIPLEMGSLELPYDTYADYAASTLGKLGLPPEKIHAAPCETVSTERTRAMARALRDFLRDHPSLAPDKRANLLSLGPHGRRSRHIFREELGPDWEVGIISIPHPEDDPDRWFLRSNSAKGVLTEIVALTLGLFGGN